MSDKPTETKSGEDPDTEIRKMKEVHLNELCNLLNFSDSWKDLMSVVPSAVNVDMPRFSLDEITLIETTAKQRGTSPAEIFLDEWGTMGKKRPTLKSLMDLLVKANLCRVADYIATEVINCPSLERSLKRPIANKCIQNIPPSTQEIIKIDANEVVSKLVCIRLGDSVESCAEEYSLQ